MYKHIVNVRSLVGIVVALQGYNLMASGYKWVKEYERHDDNYAVWDHYWGRAEDDLKLVDKVSVTNLMSSSKSERIDRKYIYTYYYIWKIGDFSTNPNLECFEAVNLPGSSEDILITTVVEGAFKGCQKLGEVRLPDELQVLSKDLFCGCTSLTNVQTGCTRIEDNVFKDCSSLEYEGIDNLSQVSSIGEYAFYNCPRLTSFCLNERIEDVGSEAFGGTTCIDSVIARCAPPDGILESGLLTNFPHMEIADEYKAVWMDVLSKCSTNLYVTISPTTNEVLQVDGYRTIMMSTKEGKAKIYYTLDGTDPTTNSAVYTAKFKVKMSGEKVVVKASAIIDGWPYNSVQSIAFATEKCLAPNASMEDGEKFYFKNQPVTLMSNTEDSIIRYTIDGSDPTDDSKIYCGPLLISETTTIKAKEFRDDYLDSDVMTVTLIREWCQIKTPSIIAYYGGIQDGNEVVSFEGSHVMVVINDATDGATIYYTIDGTDPTSKSLLYNGPFKILDSRTIKAIAIKDDWLDSEVAVASVEKQKCIGDIMKDADTKFVNDDKYAWVEDSSVFYSGAASMRSGSLPDYASTILSATVCGSGRLLFHWRADCEVDEQDHEFDHGEFLVDGVEAVGRIDGKSEWRAEDVRIEGVGEHAVAWVYRKDDCDELGYSGGSIWVDNFIWIPDDGSKVTYRSDNEIPYNWFYDWGLLDKLVPEDVVISPTGKRDYTGKALTPEADYVAGTNPTNSDSVFSALIDMSSGAARVWWTPDLNEGGTKQIRKYKIWGVDSLAGESEWEYPTNSTHRFFKVTVEMP